MGRARGHARHQRRRAPRGQAVDRGRHERRIEAPDGGGRSSQPRRRTVTTAEGTRPLPWAALRSSVAPRRPEEDAHGRDGDRDLQQLHRRRVGRAGGGAHDRRAQPRRRARRWRRRRTRPPRTSSAPSRPPAPRSTAGRTPRPASARWRCSSSPTRSRSTATRSPSSRPATPASRCRPSRTTRSPRWSTTCASSRAPRATSRARPRASTSRATRPGSRREAVGVIGQIAPWNYPLMMAIWKIGPALAAGNTIVLKPAPTTPLTTLRLGEIAAEFLPKGVLNVVAGGNETGAGARHPRRRRHGLADRLGGDRQVDRARRRRHAQARAPRARRQGAGRRLRRRRHGGRGRDDRRHRLVQRRPGLHGGHARARRLEGLRRRPAGPRRPGHGATRPATRWTRRRTSGR